MATMGLLDPKAHKLTKGKPLTAQAPCDICAIFSSTGHLQISDSRRIKHQAFLGEWPEVNLKVCLSLDPVSHFPDEKYLEHSC